MSSEGRGGNGAVVAIVVVIGIIGLLGVVVVVGGLAALMFLGVRSPGPPMIQVAPTTSAAPPKQAPAPIAVDPESPPVVGPGGLETAVPVIPPALQIVINDVGGIILWGKSVTQAELKERLTQLKDDSLRIELFVSAESQDSEGLQRAVTDIFKELNLPYTVRD